MRRTISALVVLVVSLALWTSPATAAAGSPVATGGPPSLGLRGTFEGTSVYEFSQVPTCSFVTEQYTGTFELDPHWLGGGTYVLDVCITLGDPRGIAVIGTFDVTAGFLSLHGTVDGTLELLANGEGALELVLTVTDSSGIPVPVRGTISVSGTRVEPALFTSVESGTFAADLHLGRGPRGGAPSSA